MLKVEVVQTIACSSDEFLAFVMDIERYATVDTKINRILWQRRRGNFVEFACRPTLAGLKQPKVIQHLRLTPGRRVDIALAPLPANRSAHAIAEFAASFSCRPVATGTEVTRTLEFAFKPMFGWVLEPLFRKRLPAEVHEELSLAKRALEKTQ